MSQDELSDHARAVIDANRYLALGTADAAGHPWVSPVWFATEDDRNFEVFDRVSREAIGRGWGLDDVRGAALFRLYRATASEHWVLIPGGDPERGSGVDRSEQVSIE